MSRDRSAAPAVHPITSAGNPRVKVLRALSSSRGVHRHQLALVCGRRIVDELVLRHADRIESLIYSEANPPVEAELEAMRAREVLVLPPALFREIDPIGVEPPLAVVRVEPLATWDSAAECSGLSLFLPLGDPENLGAALRSAAAFEVDRVVLLEEAAHPFHPRAIRAAAGSCFDLELRAGPSLAALLEAPPADLDLLVLDREGEAIAGLAHAPDAWGLVVGEEGRGVPARAGLRRVAIPISREVDSLNGAVAAGIALWELRGRRPRP